MESNEKLWEAIHQHKAFLPAEGRVRKIWDRIVWGRVV